jgi:hypothetical protein
MALKIESGVLGTPVKAVVYGTEGIGKTTLASKFPAPLFLDTEGGTRRLDVQRMRIRHWTELEGAFLDLARDSSGFHTVVVDSADWAEKMAKNYVCEKANKPSIEAFGYGKGLVLVGEAISRLLESADRVVDRGVNVVFVAHAKTVRVSPPDQTDGYDRYELKMEKGSSPIFKEWADLVLFCNYRTHIVEGEDGRKKAKGGRDRVMFSVRSPAFDAKNRFGLAPELPMTIEALAPIFAAPAKPAAAPAAVTAAEIRDYIAKATTVRTLGKIGTRLDELLSTGQISDDDWSELTDRLNDRHGEIEPEVANA